MTPRLQHLIGRYIAASCTISAAAWLSYRETGDWRIPAAAAVFGLGSLLIGCGL